jgi:SM-20-related protein
MGRHTLNSGFFSHMGMYVVSGFFDPEFCARLRSEVRSAVRIPSTVSDGGDDRVVDERVRSTRSAQLADATLSLIKRRLLAVKPALESYFGLVTTGYQRPQVLVYREGDFFREHTDRVDGPDASAHVMARRVSVVVLLNGESEEPAPDSYGGGSLTFYGLWDDPRLKSYCFPLAGEEGLLVAFRSEVLHAVTPVTHGERYSVVSWLEGERLGSGVARP